MYHNKEKSMTVLGFRTIWCLVVVKQYMCMPVDEMETLARKQWLLNLAVKGQFERCKQVLFFIISKIKN